jgi:multicomponent Na+:H+ antiporter subunit A
MMIILLIIMAVVIAAALVATESHDLNVSVIYLGAAGFGLFLMLLILGAWEIAVTQMIIEVILLATLINATNKEVKKETYKGREILSYFTVIAFVAIMTVISYFAFADMHAFGSPVLKMGRMYRDIDVLIAAAALFAAAVGVFAVLRTKAKKGTEEKDETDI